MISFDTFINQGQVAKNIMIYSIQVSHEVLVQISKLMCVTKCLLTGKTGPKNTQSNLCCVQHTSNLIDCIIIFLRKGGKSWDNDKLASGASPWLSRPKLHLLPTQQRHLCAQSGWPGACRVKNNTTQTQQRHVHKMVNQTRVFRGERKCKSQTTSCAQIGWPCGAFMHRRKWHKCTKVTLHNVHKMVDHTGPCRVDHNTTRIQKNTEHHVQKTVDHNCVDQNTTRHKHFTLFKDPSTTNTTKNSKEYQKTNTTRKIYFAPKNWPHARRAEQNKIQGHEIQAK